MRDAPNVELKCPSTRSSDTRKGVDSFRQQDGGHGSRNPLRSVCNFYKSLQNVQVLWVALGDKDLCK
jgi:hypothetical protein